MDKNGLGHTESQGMTSHGLTPDSGEVTASDAGVSGGISMRFLILPSLCSPLMTGCCQAPDCVNLSPAPVNI